MRLRAQHVHAWADVTPELLRETPPAVVPLYFDEPRADQADAVPASADDVLKSLSALERHAAAFPGRTRAKALVLLHDRAKLHRQVRDLRRQVAESAQLLAQAEQQRLELERSVLGRAALAARRAPRFDKAIEEFVAHMPSIMSRRNADDHERALRQLLASRVSGGSAASISDPKFDPLELCRSNLDGLGDGKNKDPMRDFPKWVYSEEAGGLERR